MIGAIRDHVQQFEVPFAIDLDLEPLPPTINAATEVALWRIVQTALDNVAKHAAATCCWLSLRHESDQIILTIADDGVGLAEGITHGVGLTSMRERTEELQGTFVVEQNRPNGTRITARIPLQKGGDA